MEYASPIHVAVGVIENNDGEVLIAKRDIKKDQGGLWEFPGGKIKDNESVFDALKRELYEELNITILQSRPLITIHYDYPHYSVVLFVHKVSEWQGKAIGNEGQDIKWQNKQTLKSLEFPKANKAIIKATELPDTILVTADPSLYDEQFFLEKIKNNLLKGIKVIQFRSKIKKHDQYLTLLKKIKKLCEEADAKLIINADAYLENLNDFDGLHLSSNGLKKIHSRPISDEKLFTVSCHNIEELKLAKHINADAIILGSVKATTSHPNANYLGWEKFKELTNKINIPIYAIGGLTTNDKQTAWNNGAQGLAMISHLWNTEE